MEKTELVVKICDKIIKYFIYVIIVLAPIFYLPITSDAFDFNKNALMMVFSFIPLFCWMLKSLMVGRLEIKKSPALISVGIFFLVFLVSTIFSIDKYGSFWGYSQVVSESMVSLMVLCVIYFIIGNVFSKKEAYFLVFLSLISAVATEILFLVMLFNRRLGFGHSNTIGSVGSLGIFSAIFLPLMIIFLINSKKWWKIFFGIGIILSTAIIVIISYIIIWYLVLVIAIIFLIFSIIKKNFFDARWMAVPVFLLAISLFFIILNPQIKWLPSVQKELSISQNVNFKIGLEVLKKSPFLGSGPATFSYDFLKYKDRDLSNGLFWGIVFNKGASKILTIFSDVGILGAISFLAVFIFTISYAGKFLFFEKEKDKKIWLIILGLFISFASQFLAIFLYPSNLTLDFVLFFIAGLLLNFTAEKDKKYVLKPNSLLTLGLVFLFTLIFIFSVGLLFIEGQRYVAEVLYYRGLADWQKGNIDKSISEMESAINLNPNSDVYFIQLSQAFIGKIQKDISDTSLTGDQKTKEIQALSSNAINSAKLATDLNPNSSSDWAVRGFIYQSLIGASADMENWAESSYKKALTMDQYNPYLITQLGIIYYNKQDYADALNQFQSAKALDPSYSNALYYLGLTYDAQNQKDLAIAEFTNLFKLNPKETNIQKIIDNLKAGNNALYGLYQSNVVNKNPRY
jgi:tetratricopeptide (TPR) repeat protein